MGHCTDAIVDLGKERASTDGLFEEFTHKGVLASDEVVKRSIEDEAAFGQHQESSG